VVSAPRSYKSGESGYALLTALLVIFLLSIALALLAASLQIRMRLVREDGASVTLSALSDAALAESLANLAQSGSYTGSEEHDFGGGRIRSGVVLLSPGVYDVVAIAKYGQRRRVVEALVFRAPGYVQVQRWRRLPG
jgi:type II secretory pathway pseudopilin PulG